MRIAGGGLSGLATAVLLARRGIPAEVFERRDSAGGRFAGGWQILENGTSDEDVLAELAALGIGPGFDAVPAFRAVFLDPSGGVHETGSASPFAYFVRRGGGEGSLDHWLERRAAELGVTIHRGAAAPAGADVVATGPRQADGVAREVVFRTSLPDTVAVLFDPRVTPTGYAYLFSLKGHATFGVAQVRRIGGLRQAQSEAWRRFRDHLGPFSVELLHEGGQFMNFSLPSDLRGSGGAWYVGEAAGVQDFLYGLGNRLALRSAALAAAGVAGEWDRDAFRSRVVTPMRATIALRFVYERMGPHAFASFCRAAGRRDLRDMLIAMQRPRALGRLLSAPVMAAWRERRGCGHAPTCGWCRRREG